MAKRKLKQPKLIFKENAKIIVNYNNLYAHTATDPQLRRMRKGKYNRPDAIAHEEFDDVFHVEKIQYRFLKHQHQVAHDKNQAAEDVAARAANRPSRKLEKSKNDNHYWYVVVWENWPPGSTTLADFGDLLCCELAINEMKIRMGLPGVSQHCDRLSKQFARRTLKKGVTVEDISNLEDVFLGFNVDEDDVPDDDLLELIQEEILEEEVPAAEGTPPHRDPPGSGDDDNGNTGNGANNDVPEAGNGNPEADNGNPEADNGNQEAGNGSTEAGNGNQEAGNGNQEGAGPSYGEKSSGSGASGGASDLPASTGGPSKISTFSKTLVYARKCDISTGARKEIWQGIAMLLAIVVPGFKEQLMEILGIRERGTRGNRTAQKKKRRLPGQCNECKQMGHTKWDCEVYIKKKALKTASLQASQPNSQAP